MSGRVWRQCVVCNVVVRLELEDTGDHVPVVCHRQRCRAVHGDDAGRDAPPSSDPWVRALRYPDR